MNGEPKQFSDEQIEFVSDLILKANSCNEKTEKHANVDLYFPTIAGSFSCPIRVDDIKLFYIGSRLLPNILNYLVNVLPTLIYPYIVAYLQDLSDDDHVITINDLYDLILSIDFNS